jgi:hypothetical protein
MRRELIVRLSGRGQYKLAADDEALLAELNELDNEIVALLAQTESKVQRLLEQMAAQVEGSGQVLDDTLASPDLILPPTDLTLAEAAALFKGEGIIPG